MRRTFVFPFLLQAIVLVSTPVVTADTLLVANKTDDTIDLIDLNSGRSAATLSTGHAPHEVGISPDGTTAVVTNYGDRDRPGSSVTIVNVPDRSIQRTIDLGEHTRPHGVAFVDDRQIVVTAEGSGHLLVIDIAGQGILRAIATGQEISHMVAVTPDGQRALVANIGSGSVTAIDLEGHRKLVDIPTGPGAEGIAVSPAGDEAWVTNREADTVSIVDPASLTVRATLPCSGYPIRIAFAAGGRTVLVSAASSGEIVVFDRIERTEIRRMPLDLSTVPDTRRRLFGDRFGDSPVPVGLVVDPAGETAWVAATQADAIVVLDPGSLQVMDLLRAGREPDGMALSRRRTDTGESSR